MAQIGTYMVKYGNYLRMAGGTGKSISIHWNSQWSFWFKINVWLGGLTGTNWLTVIFQAQSKAGLKERHRSRHYIYNLVVLTAGLSPLSQKNLWHGKVGVFMYNQAVNPDADCDIQHTSNYTLLWKQASPCPFHPVPVIWDKFHVGWECGNTAGSLWWWLSLTWAGVTRAVLPAGLQCRHPFEIPT